MPTLVQNIVGRHIAAAGGAPSLSKNDLALFKAETYFRVEARQWPSNEDKPAYLSKEEISLGKKGLSTSLEKLRKEVLARRKALTQKSGDLYNALLRSRGSDEGIAEELEGRERVIKNVENAKSLKDITLLDSAWYKEPLMYESSRSILEDGQRRYSLISRLKRVGTLRDLKAVVETGAKFDDNPDFGDGVLDTEKAAAWGFTRRKKIVEAANKKVDEIRKAMSEDLDKVDGEMESKFPEARQEVARSMAFDAYRKWMSLRGHPSI